MRDYLLDEIEGEPDAEGNATVRHQLWSATAIEKVGDLTVRLNLKAPQLAIPVHLFHYPAVMLDPEGEGIFGPVRTAPAPSA